MKTIISLSACFPKILDHASILNTETDCNPTLLILKRYQAFEYQSSMLYSLIWTAEQTHEKKSSSPSKIHFHLKPPCVKGENYVTQTGPLKKSSEK